MDPKSPPTQLTAGDSAEWVADTPSYPAPTWALQYAMVGSAAVYSIPSVADGTAHRVTLQSADTAAWAPGRYRITGYVTAGPDRHTVYRGEIVILADDATATPTDTRSHARRVLDAINAYLETGDMIAAQVQIADRRIAQISIAELLSLRDRYQAEVTAEEAGSSSVGGRVYTRL